MGYYENESESLVKATEKMALTIKDMYNDASSFLLTLSHELKNSITVIKGYAKGLKLGIIDDENLKKDFINSIYERTEELEKTIYDVLDSAYEAQSKTKVNKDFVDIEEFSSELAESSREYVLSSEINLEVSLTLEPGTMYVDEMKIKRVWNNLINNAVKYSGKGSTINIRIISESQTNRIRFEVEDRGIGIDSNEQDKIFDMFYRGENVSAKGYGLGLFICKSILDLHDSNLNFISEKGNGSIFWFYLSTNTEQVDFKD